MEAERLTVEILGRSYEIDAEGLTPIEANAIAQFVSERMKETQKQTGVVDTSRLAVLTALNLADELTRLKAKQDDLVSETLKRTKVMIKILEGALKPIA